MISVKVDVDTLVRECYDVLENSDTEYSIDRANKIVEVCTDAKKRGLLYTLVDEIDYRILFIKGKKKGKV